MKKTTFSATTYKKNNAKKAKTISEAVKRGLKEYVETFRRLATT